MVPYGFRFPSFDVHTMYNLWIFGDPSKGICPYNQISSEYDLVTYACKTNRSRTKKIANFLVKAAIDDSDSEASNSDNTDAFLFMFTTDFFRLFLKLENTTSFTLISSSASSESGSFRFLLSELLTGMITIS